MSHRYYIDVNGTRDGPHDLVTVMRRIKAGKILMNTPIYVDMETEPRAALAIEEIAIFFPRTLDNSSKKASGNGGPTLGSVLASGWRFTHEHNVMTVYAGLLLLVSLLFAFALASALGELAGMVIAWVLFLISQNIYLVFTLRLFRRQTIGQDFINDQLAPLLMQLIPISILLAIMMAGGALLLVVPGILVAILFVFTPFLMLDRKVTISQALFASPNFCRKLGKRNFLLVASLVLFHFVCVLLIIPIPVTLPIFAAALSELYEQNHSF